VRFTQPWWALTLLFALVPAAAAWLGASRRRSAAVGWGNPALTAVLAARQPRTRWASPLLWTAALLVAATALAGPERDVVDVERAATVVLTIDVSRSMEAVDVAPTRLDAAQAAAVAFLDGVDPYVRVGVVSFAGTATTLVSPTVDRDEARRAVTTLQTANATAIGDALRASLVPAQIAAAVEGEVSPAVDRGPVTVVLLSDGANTVGSDPLEAAEVARSLGVVVHTIALGTQTGTVDLVDPSTGQVLTVAVPPDVETLAKVAGLTGGDFFDVDQADVLQGVYERIAQSLVETYTTQELWRPLLLVSILSAVAGLVVASLRRRFP